MTSDDTPRVPGADIRELARLWKHVHKPDVERTQVLLVQLVAESLLEDIIVSALRHPEKVLERATFSHKIDLAAALGGISPEEEEICRVLQRCRNEFAHNLGAGLPATDRADIVRLGSDPQWMNEDRDFPEFENHLLSMLVLACRSSRTNAGAR